MARSKPFARSLVIHQPSTLHIGADTIGQAGQALGDARTLVVTTPPVAQQVARLGITGDSLVFADTPAEPDEQALEQLLRVAEEFKPQAIVGLGGGSVMDMAKLTAVLWDRRQTLQAVVGPNKVERKLCTLIQVPTTAGTGSEAGIRALVSNSSTGDKMAVESAHMRADLVILDATLSYSVPAAVTAATGVDALAHSVESFTNINAHPIIDEYARLGIKLVGQHLGRAVQDGSDEQAREAMMVASYYGGICLGPVNTAAGHAVAYPLSTELKLPHGLANALVFPHVLAFNFESCREKTLEVAQALGLGAISSSEQLLAAAFSYCENLGIEMSLQKHGAKPEQLEAMAKSAHAIRRLMDNNPRPMSVDDIHAIYKKAY